MRLIDLFEAPIPLIKQAPAKQYVDAQLGGPINKNYVGGGSWGNVYSNQDDVETVTKVSNISDNSWKLDGYYQFINKVRNYKNETHNIYLPQIYDAKRYVSKYTQYNPSRPYIVVNLERLYEYYKFGFDELVLVLQKICGKTFDDVDFKKIFDLEFRHHRDVGSIIAMLLKKTVLKERYSLKITDQDLLKALSIVRKLHHKGFALDFQSVNFMFRRTPYGPQLVLTDPISYHDDRYVKVVMGKKKPEKALEAAEPIISTSDSYYDTEEQLASYGKQLGSGYFASAFEKPDDVTTVTKIAKLNNKKWDQDGYYAYIEKIKNLKGYKCLPQIYSIKRIQPSAKPNINPEEQFINPYLVVEIEKLVPTTKLTREEIEFVFSNLVGEDIAPLFPSDQFDKNDIAQALSSLLERTITGQYSWLPESIRRIIENLKIIDPDLIKVIKILRNLYQQGYSPDIHSGNFMFRRTPYGPQIVITDPLAFKTANPIKVKMAKGEQ